MSAPVVSWQLLSKNPDRAAAFYSELFGWSVDADNPLGYRQVHTGAGAGAGDAFDGGIWPSPPEGHAFVQLFVAVDNAAAAAAKATELGGRVLIEPQALPDGDTVAILQDAEGVSFGVVEQRATA